MAAPSVTVEGLREVRKELRDFDDRVGKEALKSAHKTLADRVVRKALPRVPVRTGRLKASVRGLGSVTAARGKAGSAAVPYAAAIHWGEGMGNINASTGATFGRPARNIRGRPFLWDAIDSLEHEAVEEYAHQLDQLINRMRGR